MMSVLNEKFSIFSLQPLDAASDYFERRFAIAAFEVGETDCRIPADEHAAVEPVRLHQYPVVRCVPGDDEPQCVRVRSTGRFLCLLDSF